jgi:hypothetical protein
MAWWKERRGREARVKVVMASREVDMMPRLWGLRSVSTQALLQVLIGTLHQLARIKQKTAMTSWRLFEVKMP